MPDEPLPPQGGDEKTAIPVAPMNSEAAEAAEKHRQDQIASDEAAAKKKAPPHEPQN
jgi:hypothetical protein